MSISAPANVRKPLSPFRGLVPYAEEDWEFFFGREQEVTVLADALRASRHTLLYGESGVGKSSVLAAGLLRTIRNQIDNTRVETDNADYAIALVRSWRDDPIDSIRGAVDHAMRQATSNGAPAPKVDQSLSDYLTHVAGASGVTLLLILDQFEDYFRYHPEDDGSAERGLTAQLSRLITNRNATVNILFSVRDDSLALLDRFRGRIPRLLENTLRLEHLSEEGAKEAIIKPLVKYNTERLEVKISWTADLAERVVAQLRSRLRTEGPSSDNGPQQPRIQASLLQLLMTRLWETSLVSHQGGSAEILLDSAALLEMGGVPDIVKSYFGDKIDALIASNPRFVAAFATLFEELVTLRGRRQMRTWDELVGSSTERKLPSSLLRSALDELLTARILTTELPVHANGDQVAFYQFSHDEYALAALGWRQSYFEREEKKKIRQRLQLLTAIIVPIVIAAISFALYYRQQSEDRRSDAEKLAKATKANALAVSRVIAALQIPSDPVLSLQLLVASRPTHVNANAVSDSLTEELLRTAIIAASKREIKDASPSSLSAVSWSSDGKIVIGSYHGDVKVFDMNQPRPVGRLLNTGNKSISALSWSPKTDIIAISSGELDEEKTVQLWKARPAEVLKTLTVDRPIHSLAWNRDGTKLAVGSVGLPLLWLEGEDGMRRLQLPDSHRVSSPVGAIFGVSWNGNDQLVTASADGFLRLWNAEGGIGRPEKADKWLGYVSWAPSGEAVLTGRRMDPGNEQREPGSAVVWRTSEAKVISLPIAYPVFKGAWSTREDLLGFCNLKGFVGVWSSSAGKVVAQAQLRPGINAIAWDNNLRLAIVDNSGYLSVVSFDAINLDPAALWMRAKELAKQEPLDRRVCEANLNRDDCNRYFDSR